MSLELPPDATTRSLASIKRFFDESLDLEVGELKARMVLEFILKEIGPSIYNRAIADVQGRMHERVAELEGDCSQVEFAYWSRSVPRKAP